MNVTHAYTNKVAKKFTRFNEFLKMINEILFSTVASSLSVSQYARTLRTRARAFISRRNNNNNTTAAENFGANSRALIARLIWRGAWKTAADKFWQYSVHCIAIIPDHILGWFAGRRPSGGGEGRRRAEGRSARWMRGGFRIVCR